MKNDTVKNITGEEYTGVCPFMAIDGGECAQYSIRECMVCMANKTNEDMSRLCELADSCGMMALSENEQAFINGRITVEELYQDL